MKLLRIRLGKVETRGGAHPWTSAIGKVPIPGQIAKVGPEGILGDEQADRVNHGGVDKAILCYPREHYASWRAELGVDAPGDGSLGENLEIEELREEQVCLGDVFGFEGSAVWVEVSQPRQPCWKPARLHNRPDLTARILKSGRTGWYVRVLRGGTLAAPCALRLEHRPHPEWSVARATRVMHFDKDPAARLELAGVPALSPAWRDILEPQ